MSQSTKQKATAPAKETAANQSRKKTNETTDSNSRFQAKISVFANARAKTPDGEMTIEEFLAEIRDPEADHVRLVNEIREKIENFASKEEVDGLKKGLPSVTLSGRIQGGRANAMDESRLDHSGLLQIDLDGKDLHPLSAPDVRDLIGKDPHILAAFLSPTGTGVKSILSIPKCRTTEEHKRAFEAAEKYFLKRYKLTLDTACKDPARLCFVSHDPDLIVASREPLELPVNAFTPTQQAPGSNLLIHGTRAALDRDQVREMLAVIPPRPAYDEWLKIASAVWEALGESEGTAALSQWSPEEKPGEYAAKYPMRLKDITAGTLVHLAKENGYRSQREGTATRESQSNEEIPRDEFQRMLAERAFDIDSPPMRPAPILTLIDKPISTPGNLTAIQAGIKSGKTAVIGAIIAAVISDRTKHDADTLGFEGDNLEGRAVIHFDTEQSRFDHDACIRRALTRVGCAAPPEWFQSFSIADLSQGNRDYALETAIADAEESFGGVCAIILDGVADFMRDPNDPQQAFAFVDRLHAMAIRLDCSIIAVIHENPGSETGKTRGHLGSQLSRKAETNLRLHKNPQNGITTIWADYARHCHIAKDQGHCFAWSDTLGMHVSKGSAGAIKAGIINEKFREEAEAAFGDASEINYTGLVSAIMEAVGLKSKKTAEKRITTYQIEGLIVKNPNATYSLK